eukprot:tig00000180_g13643.t1
MADVSSGVFEGVDFSKPEDKGNWFINPNSKTTPSKRVTKNKVYRQPSNENNPNGQGTIAAIGAKGLLFERCFVGLAHDEGQQGSHNAKAQVGLGFSPDTGVSGEILPDPTLTKLEEAKTAIGYENIANDLLTLWLDWRKRHAAYLVPKDGLSIQFAYVFTEGRLQNWTDFQRWHAPKPEPIGLDYMVRWKNPNGSNPEERLTPYGYNILVILYADLTAVQDHERVTHVVKNIANTTESLDLMTLEPLPFYWMCIKDRVYRILLRAMNRFGGYRESSRDFKAQNCTGSPPVPPPDPTPPPAPTIQAQIKAEVSPPPGDSLNICEKQTVVIRCNSSSATYPGYVEKASQKWYDRRSGLINDLTLCAPVNDSGPDADEYP